MDKHWLLVLYWNQIIHNHLEIFVQENDFHNESDEYYLDPLAVPPEPEEEQAVVSRVEGLARGNNPLGERQLLLW